jgi:hypothetical protein
MISGRAISSAVRGWATTTAQRVFQRQVIYSTSGLMPYIRPPFHALALVPLGLLRYGTAFVVSVSGQAGELLGLGPPTIWTERSADRLDVHAHVVGNRPRPNRAVRLPLLIGSIPWPSDRSRRREDLPCPECSSPDSAMATRLALRRQWNGLESGGNGFGCGLPGDGGHPRPAFYLPVLQKPALENVSQGSEYLISTPGLLANLDLARWT